MLHRLCGQRKSYTRQQEVQRSENGPDKPYETQKAQDFCKISLVHKKKKKQESELEINNSWSTDIV